MEIAEGLSIQNGADIESRSKDLFMANKVVFFTLKDKKGIDLMGFY